MKKLIAIYILFHTSFVCLAQDMPFEKLDSLSTIISGLQLSANNYGYMEDDKIYTISFPQENFKVYAHDLLATHAVYKMNNGKETLELTENVDITKANHLVYGSINDELLYVNLYFPDGYLKTKVLEDGEIVDFLYPKSIRFFKTVEADGSLTTYLTSLYAELLKATGKISEEEMLQERKDWDKLTTVEYNEKYPNWIQIIQGKKVPSKEELTAQTAAEKRKLDEQPKIDFAAEVIKNCNTLLEQLYWRPNITETEFLKLNKGLQYYNFSRVQIGANTVVVQKDGANAKNWQEGPFKYVLDSKNVVLKYMLCAKNIKNDKAGEVRVLFEKSRTQDSNIGEFYTSDENSYTIKIPKSPEQRDQYQYYITTDYITVEKNSALFFSVYTEKTPY